MISNNRTGDVFYSGLFTKGMSSNLRCLYANLARDKANQEIISWFQERPYAVTSLVYYFILYLENNWDKIIKIIETNYPVYRQKLAQNIDEKRLIDVAVSLQISTQIVHDFLICNAPNNVQEFSKLIPEINRCIIDICLQSQYFATQDTPSITFLRALSAQIQLNRIKLKNERLTYAELRSFDGFTGDNYIYIVPESIFSKIVDYCRGNNIYFQYELNELVKFLADDDIIVTTPNGNGKRTNYVRLKLEGHENKISFLKIKTSALNLTDY